jgi:hypothetical protein
MTVQYNLTVALQGRTISNRMTRMASVSLALLALASASLHAQRARQKPAAPAARPAAKSPTAPRIERPVPFAVGETLSYDVSWSSYVTAGTATTTVKEKKPSFNSTAFYVVAEGRPTPTASLMRPPADRPFPIY